MHFRTAVPIINSDAPIDYDSKILSLGSCFAVNMAQKLDFYKFRNTCNPFGILFHPKAIELLINFAVSGKIFTENDIFFYNERWHCFDAHSNWSNPNKEGLLASLNELIITTKLQLVQATHLIVTYGTSWVYRDVESDSIVANCHKVPQKQFKKELLSVEEVEKSISDTLHLVRTVNPYCTIIFTVSPVRHIKDGFVENQWSKANLITAVHNVLSKQSSKHKSEYFPSYEIMMDELRDYRFYADDMLHPSQVAIDYIWKRFQETTIAGSSIATLEEIENIQRSLLHKPFNPDSESHLKFEAKLREKITKLEHQYSFMKF